MKKSNLAKYLEKLIDEKPYDQQICLDKQIAWLIIEALRS